MTQNGTLAEENLRYPIGKYSAPPSIDAGQRGVWIQQIAELPAELSRSVQGLGEAQLDVPYRKGGWTVRQIAHHLPDSHMNSYIRFRLALTESEPLIKPYREAAWAELKDAKSAPIEASLVLLEALHVRWSMLLTSMSDSDFARTFLHPELGAVALDRALGLYAWHGIHHVAQISSFRERVGAKSD